ncbi:hypothetical protein EYV94_10430 [Puteibacter caeruleilacunae]|nr:hypothetical protein EYV94_10430 [Puteibacter caeruleilacunae]
MKILIKLFCVMVSFTIGKDLKTVKFHANPRAKYSIEVVNYCEIRRFEVNTEKEQRYVCADSSYIYITNFRRTPNFENIRSLGDSLLHLRFQKEELRKQTALPDTFELSGMNDKALCWKDIKIGSISVGYVNVPEDKKELFDKSLKTLKKK